MDDETQRHDVAPGQAARLVAAFRRAVQAAARARLGLILDGADTDDTSVTPGVTEDGQPALHVTAHPVEAVRLAELIAQDSRPPRTSYPRARTATRTWPSRNGSRVARCGRWRGHRARGTGGVG